jgi:Ca2+-binding EF-hand superfamily protein
MEDLTKIDNDGSTSIDAHGLNQFLKMSGVEITQETANQLINEADDDNAGCIKFPEFKTVITELLNARKEEKNEKRSKFEI